MHDESPFELAAVRAAPGAREERFAPAPRLLPLLSSPIAREPWPECKPLALSLLKASSMLGSATKSVLSVGLIFGVIAAEASRMTVLERLRDGGGRGPGQMYQPAHDDVIFSFGPELGRFIATLNDRHGKGALALKQCWYDTVGDLNLADFFIPAYLALCIERAQRPGRTPADALAYGIGVYHGAFTKLSDAQRAVAPAAVAAGQPVPYAPVEVHLKSSGDKQLIDLAAYIASVVRDGAKPALNQEVAREVAAYELQAPLAFERVDPPGAGAGAGADQARIAAAAAIVQNRSVALYDRLRVPSPGADAKCNIADAAGGLPARRSTTGTAPGGAVPLDARMLQAMDALTRAPHGFSYRVTAIAGGTHSTTSRHYAGTAFDADVIDGVAVSKTHPRYRAFMQACRDLGATEVLGPGDPGHDTHVHAAWPRPAVANELEQLAASSCEVADGHELFDAPWLHRAGEHEL